MERHIEPLSLVVETVAEQPEMKGFYTGDMGKQEGVMTLGGAYVMSFPSIPQHPLSSQTSPSTIIYAFIS